MVVSAPQSQSQPQPLSAEEEAVKRNTDCVYFLASPLTCKKGTECDYRHSDVALVNPRDCYFWLQGNCLNPKCGFRHPPLDGLLGTQAPTSSGPSAPMSQTAMASAPHAPNASTKPGVPCIFFQKGYCLKGDWCPFLHMPNSLSNKPSLVPVIATDLANHKKALSGPPEKPFQQKTTPSANVPKSVNCPEVAKSFFPTVSAPPRNESATIRRVTTQTAGVTKLHVYRNSTPVSDGNPVNWPISTQKTRHLDDPEPEPEYTIIKDNDEISREPSPGFDVLVDDDLRDSDYYPSDDRYGLSRDHEAQNEYDIGLLPNEYSTIDGVDDERYLGRPVSYDSHDRRGRYSHEHHRAPSERRLGGSHVERGLHARLDPFDQVDEMDLRHHLAKHKKPNGLRSVISHENKRDMDQGHRGPRREDQQENTISSRLRGRIGLPRRSASPNNRNRGRPSPLRTNISLHQARICDDVRGRVDEGFRNSERNYRSPYARQDCVGEESVNFAGPKSLSELKNRKNVEIGRKSRIDQQLLGKRKHVHQGSENDLSFEGPKPLEEILKRKRSGMSRDAPNKDQRLEKGDDIQEERKDVTANNELYKSNTEAQKGEAEDGNMDASKAEEDGTPVDGGDQEFEDEGYEEGEGDYEQAGVEDYNLYEGDNREYADEDDDSDFAKKMGVMYS